jgi:phenylacetate-coenzyme A ligase PaaK-like adenylate-forming protein
MIKEFFIKKIGDKVAKKTKNNLLEIPFYRKRLKENNIHLGEVRNITSLEKLETFLNKHKIEWVTEEEMLEMSKDYCLSLSIVPQNKRSWIQASSGYTLATKLLTNTSDVILTRKRVAYTKKDLKEACKIYESLKNLLENDISLTIAIFGRLGDLCGSGTYPFLAISGGYSNVNVKTLYYGLPKNETELLQWLKECKELNISGIIGIPSTLEKLTKISKACDLYFKNLKLVGTGGDRLHKTLIEELYDIGAKIITIGYGAQEVTPLSTVAIGTIFSTILKFPATEGLGVIGNLNYVRITDKNGESVELEEEGHIRVTSPFEGTTLVDYDTKDVGKFINDHFFVRHGNKELKIPFPSLSYEISRLNEHSLRVRERNVYVKDLREIGYLSVGYEFIIGTEDNKLHIFITKPEKEKMMSYLYNLLPSEIAENTYVHIIPTTILSKYLYPAGHYKPHNIANSQITKLLLESVKK